MPPDRRVATLLAFARVFEATALDDALDVLDALITELSIQAQRAGPQERLRTIHDLDAVALQLREACEVLLDNACGDAQLRSTVFARVSKQCLAEAVARVAALARLLDGGYRAELVEQYRRIRRFWPHVLLSHDAIFRAKSPHDVSRWQSTWYSSAMSLVVGFGESTSMPHQSLELVGRPADAAGLVAGGPGSERDPESAMAAAGQRRGRAKPGPRLELGRARPLPRSSGVAATVGCGGPCAA
jgi:hypothetical protein